MKTLLLLALLIGICIGVYSRDKKPLRNTWYSAKQLRSRGYNAHFKGKMLVNYKKHLEINKL